MQLAFGHFSRTWFSWAAVCRSLRHRNRRHRSRRCQMRVHCSPFVLTSLSSALSERFLLPPRPPLPPLPRPRPPLPLPLAEPLAEVSVVPEGDAPISVFSGVPAFPPLPLLITVGAGGGVDN